MAANQLAWTISFRLARRRTMRKNTTITSMLVCQVLFEQHDLFCCMAGRRPLPQPSSAQKSSLYLITCSCQGNMAGSRYISSKQMQELEEGTSQCMLYYYINAVSKNYYYCSPPTCMVQLTWHHFMYIIWPTDERLTTTTTNKAKASCEQIDVVWFTYSTTNIFLEFMYNYQKTIYETTSICIDGTVNNIYICIFVFFYVFTTIFFTLF